MNSGDQLRRPRVPFERIRPILNQRPRLEPKPFRSKPLDLDPTAENRAYPFGLVVLLKSPRLSLKSTRSPGAFKNNYSWAQFLADNPLAFLKIEPAVQLGSFYALALGSF